MNESRAGKTIALAPRGGNVNLGSRPCAILQGNLATLHAIYFLLQGFRAAAVSFLHLSR